MAPDSPLSDADYIRAKANLYRGVALSAQRIASFFGLIAIRAEAASARIISEYVTE